MSDWQPGDPLYTMPRLRPHLPMFEFKDGDVDYPEPQAIAARWPEPFPHRDLDRP